MPDFKATSVLDDLFDTQGSDLIRDANGARFRAAVCGQARRIAARLNDCHLEPGDRVAILCKSPVEAVIGFLAVLMTPYCAVPVHPAAPPAAIGHVLADSGARALVIGGAADDLDPQLAGLERVSVSDARTGDDMAPRRSPPGAEELAAILYTSGTTGAPKGVKITVANLESMTEQLVNDFFRVDHSDTLLMAAPLTNIYGVALTMVALRARASLSIPADLRPATLMETLIRDRVSFVAGAPVLGMLMLRAAKEMQDPLPHLRRALLAGSRLEPALAKAFAAKFNAEVMTGYAMTEAVPLAMALDLAKEPEGSVGTVARDIQIRIVSADMKPVETGDVGEVLVKGRAVTPGYWRAPEANAQAFHDGWFRTGDVGRLNESGHLELVGRVKEIIKTAGNTVYPVEVETVLKDHPSIQDIAVVGEPHESLGEVVVAYFIPRGDHEIGTADFKTWCRDRLISWKVPRRFTPIDAFPMTASGKIAKFRLRSNDTGLA